ncbi:MAG: flagellar brake protein [Burkholderiaceae bacterium]|nr:MAG: flagellar brake protein [Burkholderiaceae bacterium]
MPPWQNCWHGSINLNNGRCRLRPVIFSWHRATRVSDPPNARQEKIMQDNLPTPEALSNEIEQYQVYSRIEMVSIFRSIAEKHSFVTVYFNQGEEFFVTTLLAVNPDFEEMVFDQGADAEMHKKMLASQRLLLVGFVEQIKVQFTVPRAEPTLHEGRPAFRVRMPDSILRLQRRNFYRVPLPQIRPLTCQIPRPDKPGQVVEVRIADLSVGGVAMMILPSDLRLESGMILQNCKIDIPDFGTVTTALEIRHLRADDEDSKNQRAGCQFVGIPGPMMSVLQRYINQVDRERRQLT